MAVLERLRALDPVSYLRFASVYKDFEDIADFEAEVVALQKYAASADLARPVPEDHGAQAPDRPAPDGSGSVQVRGKS